MPLHIKLQQYKVLYVAVTIFFLVLGWDAWSWFKAHHSELSEPAAAGLITIFLAVIGALKYVLENSRQDRSHDDSK